MQCQLTPIITIGSPMMAKFLLVGEGIIRMKSAFGSLSLMRFLCLFVPIIVAMTDVPALSSIVHIIMVAFQNNE